MKNYFKSAIMAAAAIAVVGSTSCKKENGPAPDEIRDAILSITLVNPPQSRVAGTAPGTAHTITDVSLFVLDDKDNVAWKLWVPDASTLVSKTAEIQVTTAAKAVYAIANAGTDLTGTYTTKAQLESASPQVELGTQYTVNRWATGSEDGSTWSFQSPDSDGDGLMEQNVSLTLRFIAARITVVVNNNMTGYTGNASTVRITDVAVLNARGESRLFPGSGSSLIPSSPSAASKKFIEGLDSPDQNAFDYFPSETDYTVEAADVNQLNSPYTYSAGSPSNSYFYVFENDADELAEFPTIVTLVGLDVDDNPTYFPVHLASYETWASNTQNYAGGVERGKSYNITINLNGDARIGTGGGTDDPTVNVKNVELMVSLEIADWTAVPLGKNF